MINRELKKMSGHIDIGDRLSFDRNFGILYEILFLPIFGFFAHFIDPLDLVNF